MNEFYIFSIIFLLLAMAFLIKPFRPGLAKVQLFIALVFSIGVAFVYYKTGYIKEWAKFEFNEKKVLELAKELKTPEKVIERLKTKLDEQPNSAEGWFLLGRLYRANNQLKEAVSAFKKASALEQTNDVYLNAYFEAKFWDNGGLFTQTDLNLLEQQKGLNPEVLNLIAGYFFQHQQYTVAIKYWQQMASLLSEEPKVQQEVMSAIDKAKEKLQLQKLGVVEVEIDAADAIKQKYNHDASVFIYAKGRDAGPPLAVIRRNLSELKDKVTLSDAEAMIPGRVLSKYKNAEVYVGARIEPTGKLSGDPKLPQAIKEIKLKNHNQVSLLLNHK